MKRYSHISVAIPILAERDNLSHLLEALNRQTISGFDVYFCVNNPEGWNLSQGNGERAMYLDNQATLEYLNNSQFSILLPASQALSTVEKKSNSAKNFQFSVIDRSSPGKGWTGKRYGVGWARKVLFDTIVAEHDDDELIVSLDADTSFGENYLESVLVAMNSHADAGALAVPYYHPLGGDDGCDRAMLRYEIYMRHYLINLLQISNPYAFSALGSAMVFPAWAYKRVGGITPLQGGEDFYLMQKFAKTGKVLLSGAIVYPQGRKSSRVPFGTGPAIAKGLTFMDSTYPLYSNEGFDAVAETYALFPSLYEKDIETPMSSFLRRQLKTDDLWQPLRKNFKSRELFVHACEERVDGLRILQYLKTFPLRPADEEIQLFCRRQGITISHDFSFQATPVQEINALRNDLFSLEMRLKG